MARPYGSLNKRERALYEDTVFGSHHRTVELEVYRRDNGKPVLSLTNRFLGGSVQGDVTQSPVTHLECDLIDEAGNLDWSHGAHRKFEVQVIDSRFVPELDEWVSEKVFRGPMWSFDRAGPEVHLVAHGPERNAMGSIRKADFWPAKTKATVVIKALLRMAGAKPSDVAVPDMNRSLPRDVTVGVRLGKRRDTNGKEAGMGKDKRRKVRRFTVSRKETYWSEAVEIAEALDRDLFGDGRGKFVMEPQKDRPTVRLTERSILAPVKVTRGSDGEQTNTWIVKGPNPKGPKGRPSARVSLPKRHPLSAESLNWNGTPRPMIEEIENKHVKTDREAKKLGERRRDAAQRELVAYEVSALPVIPWVRPNMKVSVPVGGSRETARVPSWTLPLGPGADPLVLGASERRGRGGK